MFDHPLRLLLLLPVVILGAWWIGQQSRPPSGMSSQTWARLGREARPKRLRLVAILRWLALTLWLVAWAGPRWGVERIRIERSSYDIVFAVDCSRSMLAEDLAPSRKLAARQELTDLMGKLEGNRFGLVGFADEAFVFCPLTRDSAAATLFLEQLEENSFARQGTDLSKALQAAASLFPGQGQGQLGTRVIVLLSDGEDRRSDPRKLASQLTERNILVHTVALGSREGAKIPLEGGGFHKDSQGKEVITKADEATLKEIAALTGGQSFRLGSVTDTLQGLVNAITVQDRRRIEKELSTHKRHQFSAPLLLGLLCLALAQLLVPRLQSGARS
jgi:Ca-activated chloride channel family protein